VIRSTCLSLSCILVHSGIMSRTVDNQASGSERSPLLATPKVIRDEGEEGSGKAEKSQSMVMYVFLPGEI
jgi:hypothetical protein